MQIDESDEQPENADSAIDESLEPDSNVTVERDLHLEKHHLPRLSTEEGMKIDESDEHQANADSPIDKSLEADSKITVEIVRHSKKHPISSRSIVFPIRTADSLPKYS
jgi:hypothetical protein